MTHGQRRERARLEQRDRMSGGVGESKFVERFFAEAREVELDPESLELRRVAGKVWPHPGQRRGRNPGAVQPDVKMTIGDHRVWMRPDFAHGRLHEANRLVKRQRRPHVRGMHADLEETPEHDVRQLTERRRGWLAAAPGGSYGRTDGCGSPESWQLMLFARPSISGQPYACRSSSCSSKCVCDWLELRQGT